jgi:serine phosphatase RsbU (regulator of sigma subunit)
VVDTEQNRIIYAAAGSPSPILRRARGLPLVCLESSGVPLGISVSAAYACAKANFSPGGMLFLYSDILTDCTDRNGQRAGEDGAFALIERGAAEDTAEAAVGCVCAPFLDPPGQSLCDDLTVVCIRRP